MYVYIFIYLLILRTKTHPSAQIFQKCKTINIIKCVTINSLKIQNFRNKIWYNA